MAPKRNVRTISFVVGGLCEPPVAERTAGVVQWFRVDGSDVVPQPYRDVRFRFEQREGSWICTGLYLISGVPLTGEEVRLRFPFAGLEEMAVEGVALRIDAEPPRITAPRRRGRAGNPDEFLQQVADLYRYATGPAFAQEHPEYRRKPVQWILDEHPELGRQGHKPHEDTVRAWLRRARKRGILGDAIPGKAGERHVAERREAP